MRGINGKLPSPTISDRGLPTISSDNPPNYERLQELLQEAARLEHMQSTNSKLPDDQ